MAAARDVRFPGEAPAWRRCFLGHSPPGCSLVAPCQPSASPGNLRLGREVDCHRHACVDRHTVQRGRLIEPLSDRRRAGTPTSRRPSGSSARSKRSVSVAWSRLARLMCANSSTSSSNMTITKETIRAATTNSCSDRHLRSTRTPTLSGGSASADFSASTTERPHEGAADYLHLTGSNHGGRSHVVSSLEDSVRGSVPNYVQNCLSETAA